jgi:hypothetical protein
MRRYVVIYTTTGFNERQSSPFDTFEEARRWAIANCSGWWTISNYYA